MKTPEPRVTLVTIAFNEARRVPACVRAILAQVIGARFELLIIDDGSTDQTSEAAAEAAHGDSRVRVLRLAENRGRGGARSAGVGAARGDFIGFVDADCEVPPDWLAVCLREITAWDGVGGTPVPDGDVAALARVSGATPRVTPPRNVITGSNCLFRREALEHVGFDPADRLGEDTRLVARLTAAGYRLRRIPGLIVMHNDQRSYGQALRWRFSNGLDASTVSREIEIPRLSDAVWVGWLFASIAGLALAALWDWWWMFIALAATAAAGVTHAASRFRPRPLGRFIFACLANVPLIAAYLLGRTAGIPRLFRGAR